LPSDEFQFGDEPATHGRRVLKRLYDLSQYDGVAAFHLQPQHDEIPLNGRACGGDAVYKLPHRIAMVCPGDDVCELPSGEFQFGDEPAAHGWRILKRLHNLSHDDRMAAVDVQSQHDKVSVDGRACNGDTVHELP